MLTVTKSSLKLFLQDLWKDSRCLDIVEQEGEKRLRRFSDNCMTIPKEVEFINRLQSKITFKIPDIRQVTDDYIAFRYIEGTRAFNLLMDLRFLYRHDNQTCYRDLGILLLDLLQQDLAVFQKTTLNDTVFTGNCSIYPVREKMEALYRVLTDILPQTCQFEEIEEDLARIAAVYSEKAMVPFRDATPKNTILEIPSLFKQRFETTKERLQVIKKMCQSGEMIRILDREVIHQIDFSGCHFLCPSSDDWIALKEHESTAWLTAAESPKSPDEGISRLCTRFVRFSRFAGRKLAYRLLNHSGHAVRFILDNESGYFITLSNVCRYLQDQGVIVNDRLADLMYELFQATGFKPEKDYLQEMRLIENEQTYYSDVYPN